MAGPPDKTGGPVTMPLKKHFFSSLFFFASLLLPAVFLSPSAFADFLDAVPLNETTPAQAYQEALALKNEGRLDEAEAKLKDAIQLDPGNPAYHFELANLYVAAHDASQNSSSAAQSRMLLENVARELDQTLMLDPHFLPAQFNLAITYKRLGYYERARDELRRVMEKADALGDANLKRNAMLQMGSVYEEQGFFEEARSAYIEAKDLDYGNSDAQDALDNLEQHQQWSEQRSRRQNMTRNLQSMQQMSALRNPNSSLNRNTGNSYGYQQDPFSGSSNPYGYSQNPYGTQQQADPKQQMISSLGSLLAQQFLGGGNSSSSSDSQSSY